MLPLPVDHARANRLRGVFFLWLLVILAMSTPRGRPTVADSRFQPSPARRSPRNGVSRFRHFQDAVAAVPHPA